MQDKPQSSQMQKVEENLGMLTHGLIPLKLGLEGQIIPNLRLFGTSATLSVGIPLVFFRAKLTVFLQPGPA